MNTTNLQTGVSRNSSQFATGLWLDDMACGLEASFCDTTRDYCVLVMYGTDTPTQDGAVNLATTLMPNVKTIGIMNESGWMQAVRMNDSGDWTSEVLSGDLDGEWPELSQMMGPRLTEVPEVELLSKLTDAGYVFESQQYMAPRCAQ